MIGLQVSSRRFSLYRENDKKFRFGRKIVCGQKRFNLAFSGGVLENMYDRYLLRTPPLTVGTHDYKINSVDDLSNINIGSTATGFVIPDFLRWPKSLITVSVNDNDVTLSWTAPTNGLPVAGYKIYGNDGGGLGVAINRSALLATVLAGVTTATFTVADGAWLFVVESYDAVSETVNYFTALDLWGNSQPVSVPTADTPPIIPEDPVYNVTLSNVSVGKCKIRVVWPYSDNIAYFRVYHDNATGVIDWDNYAFRFARSTSVVTEYITAQICAVDVNTNYLFGIRPETEDGVVDDNTNEYLAILDGVAPDNVLNFAGEVV